ncbi:hypothetical protein [Vibrio gazogenes]|uniref:Uncharacterized protein n=1 Tax=Vibrio gazogenes DSM 21264 = NBRC 103151 TaxID=1123492 RepID=A0A1M5EIZ0_VIBGA|nr:hypothetical protein [Vibrio gazogenes]USP12526.1 hypothetical protein MKS89_08650 [Vibrio gazogenes]SHF79022.1 hypothetical protein SAMN02745781_03166 [Vibrio gazogenes DSM 21264] [Vibrio gazogenes DSM 21264 = NBRC 103151]SJN53992.1 hypothetical protein BQ6471_00755 [Vibrio gazogenes]
MIFKDKKINKEHRFSIGVEEMSGKYFVSIPVSNSYVDYEEYYEIDESQFQLFYQNMELALSFVKLCRERKKDHLLLQPPGDLRGEPM